MKLFIFLDETEERGVSRVVAEEMDTLEGTRTDIAKCGNTDLENSSWEIYVDMDDRGVDSGAPETDELPTASSIATCMVEFAKYKSPQKVQKS